MTDTRPEPRPVPVSPAEARVIGAFMRDGASNCTLAERLGITEHTVKSHMKRVLAATGYTTRTELAVGIYRREVAFVPADKPILRRTPGGKPINHGTWGGYVAHCIRHDPACEPCIEASHSPRRRRS